MSTNIGILAVDKKLIAIQDDVRKFFQWDVQSDLNSALEMLSLVEEYPIDIWKRTQRSVTLANLRRRLVLRDTNIAVLGAAVEESEVLSIFRFFNIISSSRWGGGCTFLAIRINI